jgi:hypothetical protein
MASLTEQYGEAEAQRMWELWLMDEAWMQALYQAEFGSRIWASWQGGRMGTFERAATNSNRIIIHWLDDDDVGHDADLWEFQGQGGYQIMDKKGNVEKGFCHTYSCQQALFDYDSEGRIIGDRPFGWQRIAWEKNLFGMTPMWFDPSADIHAAPWSFTEPWLVNAASTVMGWLNPIVDVAFDIAELSNPLMPLTVSSVCYEYDDPSHGIVWRGIPEDFK